MLVTPARRGHCVSRTRVFAARIVVVSVDGRRRSGVAEVSGLRRGLSRCGRRGCGGCRHCGPDRETRWIHARVIRISQVKPSTGETQTRYVCETLIQIGKVERRIEISLVSREGMRCRMLIGRSAMEGLVVDPNREYLLTSNRRKARVVDPILEHPRGEDA